RSSHDGRLRHGEFAGAIDDDQRNAGPGDERLQLRLSWRHAHGKFIVGMAGAALYRSGGAHRERIAAGRASCLFSGGATTGRDAVITRFISAPLVLLPGSAPDAWSLIRRRPSAGGHSIRSRR